MNKFVLFLLFLTALVQVNATPLGVGTGEADAFGTVSISIPITVAGTANGFICNQSGEQYTVHRPITQTGQKFKANVLKRFLEPFPVAIGSTVEITLTGLTPGSKVSVTNAIKLRKQNSHQ